ncbi:PP2C family protein-serine/threonine phosphatase [Actinomarinicola tropica]|uniref:SpoIIE family protein phosphatase n=1 Tax=Actinomarinicola tropica TaxID=2789776 RepID=A0A5Q2RK84_9ACTN|nr:SpoIIE family protein phosphatase [Actinomarinicola tropica]QGG94270.1 SpoIIE family protein phosphatase [Actinomarinicola tropica]
MPLDDALLPAPPGTDPWIVMSAVPQGIVIVDEDDRVAWANPAAVELLERPATELVGATADLVEGIAAAAGVQVDRRPTPDGGGSVLLLRGDDRAAAETSLLGEASDRLSGSLHLGRTMALIAELVVPRMADACTVGFVEGRVLRRTGAVVTDDGGVDHVAEEDVPVSTAAALTRRAWRTGSAELHQVVDPGAAVPEGAAWSTLRDLELGSAMVVPLRARGVTLGALVLLRRTGREPFGAADLRLAEAFARRAAIALDNAALYRDRSLVARMLQQSLLPALLPDIPHLDVGARYRPLVMVSEIGGDFYDVFPTGGDRWAVVVGDVCGKGLGAAAMTGLARHSVRTAAIQADAPSGVLAALNDTILSEDGSRHCTVVYANVEPTLGGADVTIASGGHPPPFVLRADGAVEEVPVRGTLLGVLPEPRLTDVAVHLGPGDSLVLYTDGVIEARVDRREFGEPRLRQTLAESRGLSADAVAEHVLQEVADFVRSDQTDDIAVVVVRVPGGSDA